MTKTISQQEDAEIMLASRIVAHKALWGEDSFKKAVELSEELEKKDKFQPN